MCKEKESILNKINNLLKMTVENGCSENEALNAMELARKLMLKYKIDQKDLIDKTEKDIISLEIDTYNANIPWIYILIDIISTNFGVLKYYNVNGRIRNAVLFGIKEDVECVASLIHAAHNYAELNASKYAKEHRELFGTAKGIKYSWFAGFNHGLKERYDNQNKTNNKYEIMLTVNKNVKNEFNNLTANFEKKERVIKNINNDAYAYMNGYTKGKEFGTTALKEEN